MQFPHFLRALIGMDRYGIERRAMLINAYFIKIKGLSDLICTYILNAPYFFVSLSHVRFDLIEILLQFFHISF